MLRYAGYAIVYAILLGAVAYTIRGERRQARRGDRLDSMIDVVSEREQEPRNLAWPPGTSSPVLAQHRDDFDQWRKEISVQIHACPDCGTDLIDEAFSFWCPSCQQSVSFAQAIGDDA